MITADEMWMRALRHNLNKLDQVALDEILRGIEDKALAITDSGGAAMYIDIDDRDAAARAPREFPFLSLINSKRLASILESTLWTLGYSGHIRWDDTRNCVRVLFVRWENGTRSIYRQ